MEFEIKIVLYLPNQRWYIFFWEIGCWEWKLERMWNCNL